MCLIINTTKHCLDSERCYKPKTTILPRKVYKILYTDAKDKNTYTPYQGTTVNFKYKKAILKESAMLSCYRRSWDRSTIEIGIHAFYNKKVASDTLNTIQHDGNYAIFEAIIPPFTKYFIGRLGDIVCEKLIIKNKTI